MSERDHLKLLGSLLPSLPESYVPDECGSVGRGKTFAGGWALLAHGGAYVGGRELSRVCGATYSDDVDRAAQLLREPLLVVDEVGREPDAQRMQSALLDVLDERRDGKRRTILIGNLPAKVFRKRYPDPRLVSRMRESAQWVVDTGEDMRGTK